MPNDESELRISRERLIDFMAFAITDSDLENTGKRFRNDLLFAPPERLVEDDFTQASNYSGE